MTKTATSSSAGKKRPRNTRHAAGNNKNDKKKPHGKRKGSGRPPKRVPSIVFDAEARQNYLRGFSARKKQRRAYGLAMQKVKDRQAKLEQRAELKSAERERIAEAEERKQAWLREQQETVEWRLPRDDLMTNQQAHRQQRGNDDDDSSIDSQSPAAEDSKDEDEDDDPTSGTDVVQTYQDELTQQQWGGLVTVTMSTHIPGAEDDDEDDKRKLSHNGDKPQRHGNKKRRTQDAAQEYAGHVERFLKDLKGHMPSSKKKKQQCDHHKRRGGKHGAANMKGVGSAADLKTAQKVLARTTKGKKQASGGGFGNKKRKR